MSYYTNMELKFADFAEYSAWYDDKLEYELLEDDDIEYELVGDDDIEHELVDDDASSDSVDISFYISTNVLALSNKLEEDMKQITKMCDDADIGHLIFKHKYTQFKRNLIYKCFTKFKKMFLRKAKPRGEIFKISKLNITF